MNVNNKYELGQLVYLRHDQMQSERMVTSFIVGRYDIIYKLTCGLDISQHYDKERFEEIASPEQASIMQEKSNCN